MEAGWVAKEAGIHPALAQILLKRGFQDVPSILNFLNPSEESLQDPLIFKDMARAVERIRQAIEKNEKILVYGDYDVDGITGAAILYLALRKLNAPADVYIPDRVEDGYGLNSESLSKLLKNKYKLVITVDNGITSNEAIDYLNEKKVDAIIVDHHTPKTSMPKAYAVVAACNGGQGDANLAACGLAFKVAWALLGGLNAAREFLDLVTIGTIADIANVTGENRVILKLGLPAVLATRRVGLKALMETAKLSKYRLSYRDVAFMIAPRINASGRMGSPLNAFRLLVTESPIEAYNLAQILEDGNKDRQKTEAQNFEEAVSLIESELFDKREKVIVVESLNWHEGVVGIMASRLVERYKKPAIVIALRGNSGKGSGRSIPQFSLFDLVSRCESHLDKFGGHAMACGLSIQKDNIRLFRKHLNECAEKEEALGKELPLEVDAEIALEDVNAAFLGDLDKLSPFGPGNRRPLFLTRGLRPKGEFKKRGQDTLCGWVSDAAGKTTCEIVGFRAFERWNKNAGCARFDLVHQPAMKDFNGISSIQLEIEDWFIT